MDICDSRVAFATEMWKATLDYIHLDSFAYDITITYGWPVSQ